MSDILVVDDDDFIRQLLTFRLERAGHVVRTASDGALALIEVTRSRPDVVILDWMMPGMSGLDVCRRLKADAATADLKVLLLTARADDADVADGLAAGADDYLAKPFEPSVLLSRIDRLRPPEREPP